MIVMPRSWRDVRAAGRTTLPLGKRRCLETAMRQLGQSPIGQKSAATFANLTARNSHLNQGVAAPAGAVYLWDQGSGPDYSGHIAVSDGERWCWTVDWHSSPSLTRVRVADVTAAWSSLRFRGWSSWYGPNQLDTRPPLIVSIKRLTATQLTEQTAGRDVTGYKDQGVLLERALAANGHSPGPVDGHLGLGYTAAVRAYQRSIDNPADGVLGALQARRLILSAGMDDRARIAA